MSTVGRSPDLLPSFDTSVNLACLAKPDKRHLRETQTGPCLEEEVLALMRSYKSSNESE